jgi:hypothetical protein
MFETNPVVKVNLGRAGRGTVLGLVELPGKEAGLGIHLQDFVFQLLNINPSRISGPLGR